mmetsp:Transcript_19803/g.39458  ORF Transcript_19803/g.39458 Transcript_19803/m.39458 type:complete len:207 (+) Transcript_19803:706-1326(+)
MSMKEFALVGIQRESVDAGTEGDDKDRGRRIQAISRRNHVVTFLQKRFLVGPHASGARPGEPPVYSEDGPHGQARVDVRRPVDGIEHRHVVPRGEGGVAHHLSTGTSRVLLLGRHGAHRVPTPAQRPQHDGVAHHVEFLLDLSLDVLVEGQPVGTGGGAVEVVGHGPLDDAVDLLARPGNRQQHRLNGAYLVHLPALHFKVTGKGS